MFILLKWSRACVRERKSNVHSTICRLIWTVLFSCLNISELFIPNSTTSVRSPKSDFTYLNLEKHPENYLRLRKYVIISVCSEMNEIALFLPSLSIYTNSLRQQVDSWIIWDTEKKERYKEWMCLNAYSESFNLIGMGCSQAFWNAFRVLATLVCEWGLLLLKQKSASFYF